MKAATTEGRSKCNRAALTLRTPNNGWAFVILPLHYPVSAAGMRSPWAVPSLFWNKLARLLQARSGILMMVEFEGRDSMASPLKQKCSLHFVVWIIRSCRDLCFRRLPIVQSDWETMDRGTQTG